MGDVSFSNTVEKLLGEGDTSRILTLFNDGINPDEIWDSIPVIARYLNKNTKEDTPEIFTCCQTLMEFVTTVGKPEEVLLQFIEEIETAEDDVKFLTLLPPLEIVLLRLPDKRITSLAWCFNAIKTYLVKLEIPEGFNLTPEERLLLDSSSNVIRIITLYEELLTFSETISHEFTSPKTQNTPLRKQVLGKFFIELLGQPLAYLDMEMYKKTKPKARLIAERLTKKSTIITDPFVFLDMQGNDDGSDLIRPNDLSLGVYYYLMLHEQVCNVPKVYNSTYVLHNSLKFITALLTQECQFTIEKGIHLAEAILKSVNRLQLPYLLLDSEHHSRFCKTVSNIIVHNESETIRKTALQVLCKYLWGFEDQGRYFIILNLMSVLGHSGLKGYLIMQYKEMLTQQLRAGQLSKYYQGRLLFHLLEQFTHLKDNEKSDMVDESDQIVSTLNLLRYLILADKKGITHIDYYLGILEEGYLKFVKTGIELSKEHYRLKLKEIKEETKNDGQVSVTVSGRSLEIPNEKKVEIMNMSLTTLDVLDSLLSRVSECIRIRHNLQ